VQGSGKGVDVKLLSIHHITRRRCKNIRLIAIVVLIPLLRRITHIIRGNRGILQPYFMAAMRGEGDFRHDPSRFKGLSAEVQVDQEGRPLSPVYAWCGHPDSSRVRRQWSHGSTAKWRLIDFNDIIYAKRISSNTNNNGFITWAARYGAQGVVLASLAVQQACVDLLEALTDDGHIMLPLGPSNVIFISPDQSNERILFIDTHGKALHVRHRGQRNVSKHGGGDEEEKETSMAAHLMALVWPLHEQQHRQQGGVSLMPMSKTGLPMLDRLHTAMSRITT
jgi:hypothetical protein